VAGGPGRDVFELGGGTSRVLFWRGATQICGGVGSPTAADAQQEYQTNYSKRGKLVPAGRDDEGQREEADRHRGSMEGGAAAEKTYRHLAATTKFVEGIGGILPQRSGANCQRGPSGCAASAGLRLVTGEHVAGMVTNPFLGTGLVAVTADLGKRKDLGSPGFWARFVLDFTGAECGGRFFEFADGAGAHR